MQNDASVRGERPLTEADVDAYLAMLPVLQGLPAGPVDLHEIARLAEARGVEFAAWWVTQARISRAASGRTREAAQASEADRAFVAPDKERIQKAQEGRCASAPK